MFNHNCETINAEGPEKSLDVAHGCARQIHESRAFQIMFVETGSSQHPMDHNSLLFTEYPI